MVWPALAKGHDRETEQDREQQHLEDLAGREGANDRVRNDVQEEIDGLLGFGLLGETGDLAASARAPPKPAPGRTTLPTIRPINSAKVETISK